MRILKKNYQQKSYWIVWAGQILILTAFLAVLIFYRIGFDFLMITLMLCSAWCTGCFFKLHGKGNVCPLLRMACGLATLGLQFYLLLVCNWGGRTQYLIILFLPIGIWYFRRTNTNHPIKRFIPDLRTGQILFCLLMLLLFVYSSAPISAFDALTGHLPITMYASRNGGFNTNIIESLTYSQTGMLLYGYATVFAAFGAYKALSMFNVALFFLIFATLYVFSKKIYRKTNLAVLTILFFSVPLFFEFSTIYYVEMLPVYLTFSGFLAFVDLKPKQGWNSLPQLGLLFGCAVISKLTISYTVFAGGLIAIALFFLYAARSSFSFGRVLGRFLFSGVIFLAILAVPFGLSWYRYGNPVFPWFNGLFRSPYFSPSNFVDPFDSSPLCFSLQSVLTMVFHTGNNIEMYSGGMGIFLLFLPLIPISWLIQRDWKLIVWGALPFVSYGVSTLFTYNLRYYMAIFMLANILLSISLCLIFDRLFKRRSGLYAILLACAIAVPGIWYILKYYPLKTNLTQVSKDVSQSVYSGLLKEIPPGKRVISSESFKGDYDGYLTSTTWHGTSWMLLSQAENISVEEYFSCFDYFICNTARESETALLERCLNSGLMDLERLGHENSYNLYAIHGLQKTVVISAQTDGPPRSSTGENPFYVHLDTKPLQVYRITQTLKNLCDEPMQFRFQIVWMDGEGNSLDVATSLRDLRFGDELQEFSDEFQAPEGAVSGVFYLGVQQEGKEILIHSYSIEEVPSRNTDAVSRLERIIDTREPLKK